MGSCELSLRISISEKMRLPLSQTPRGFLSRESLQRALFDCPILDVSIPHTARKAAASEQQEGSVVPLYVRYPKGASRVTPCPAVVLMCGLDGHRPDNTVRSDEFLKRGWASVIVDIPGTADCPADRRDPTSAERLWTSILDW